MTGTMLTRNIGNNGSCGTKNAACCPRSEQKQGGRYQGAAEESNRHRVQSYRQAGEGLYITNSAFWRRHRRLPKSSYADILRCPTQYFVVILHFDTELAFGGDPDTPAAYGEISAIGKISAIGGENNRKIVADITAVFEKELGISNDRFFLKVGMAVKAPLHEGIDVARLTPIFLFMLQFANIAASDWGWKSDTFEALLASGNV